MPSTSTMKAPMRRLSRARRAVVGASLLGAGVVLGVITVSSLGAGISLGAITASSPPVGAAHELCRVSAVDVTFRNNSGSSLPLSSTRYGSTNGWCTLPGNPVGPHSVTQFEAGDNFFKTELNVAYLAPNNDTIALQASSGYGGVESPEARCHVVANGRTPSPYRCSAKVHLESLNRGAAFGLNTPVALVDWEVSGP
jgi:hypothetical protein